MIASPRADHRTLTVGIIYRSAFPPKQARPLPLALGFGLGTVTAISMLIGLAMIYALLRRARRVGLLAVAEAA